MAYWKKFRRKFQTSTRLSLEEWRLVVAASFWLIWLKCALPILGFRRCLAIGMFAESDAPPGQLVAAQPTEEPSEICEDSTTDKLARVCKCVRIAIRNSPLRPNCLRSSLVLSRLLHQQGIKAALRIGVRPCEGAIEAHAWVESQGMILNDQPSATSEYQCFTDQHAVWKSLANVSAWR